MREDGLSQVEVAELLGRHKSWVCRRLALIERLGSKARDELRVGLLGDQRPIAALLALADSGDWLGSWKMAISSKSMAPRR